MHTILNCSEGDGGRGVHAEKCKGLKPAEVCFRRGRGPVRTRPKLLTHDTMQMTAGEMKTIQSNDAYVGNEAGQSPHSAPPPPPKKKKLHKTMKTKMQQATTKLCSESSKDSPLSASMGNNKNSTHRRGERSQWGGEWGTLVGEMTYPSLSALVDGAGAGTVTVPTLSSLI